ncbi:uncharacterized protein LOC62_02G002006 [Vanrija pseudolonga]|uniref:Uncharacterized protein n=1 Tax=Vanrija pseudolonga TaxID=143232 RepID=A0AAF0Y7V9_9TREE|nr:hypothetical protein LOC62_02G002006 [Vanrija pseudolonga]
MSWRPSARTHHPTPPPNQRPPPPMPVLIPAPSEHGHMSWSSPPTSPSKKAISLIPDFAHYLQPRVRRLTTVSDARSASASASPSPVASPRLGPSEPPAPAPADMLETSVRTTFTFPGAIGQAEYDRVDRLALELFQECGFTPYHSGFLVRPADGDDFATRFWVQTAPRYSGEFEDAVRGFIRAVLGEAELAIDVRVEDEVW